MLRRYSILPILFLCATCAVSNPDVGTGRVILSPRVQASFEEYMARDAPLYFLVTESGVGSYYIHCEGGFNCTRSAARMQVLDLCRRHNTGEDCKVYAIGRNVVWRNADAPRPAPQLSATDWLIRECLEGATPALRIDRCSKAVASSDLAQSQKRGPYYVRARAYEQTGRTSEAERDYRAVLGIDPDHPGAKARLEDLPAPAALPGPPRPNSA